MELLKLRKILCRVVLSVLGVILGMVLLLAVVPLLEHVSKKPAAGSADWMAAVDGSRLLNEINLPGTHDSATTYAELAFFSRCQDLTITEQLEAGIRYLDIRLGTEEGKMKLMHGFTNAKKNVLPWSEKLWLTDVLTQCYDFLKQHPMETIVFMVKQEYGDESVAEFETLLNSYIAETPDYWYLGDKIPTLQEARGKLVLMRRYDDKAEFGAASGIPMAWGNPEPDEEWNLSDIVSVSEYPAHTLKVQDMYELDTKDKWTAFSDFLDYCEKETSLEEVRIHFLSTKGSLAYGHPYYFAAALNKKFLKTELVQGTNYGWIILDFANPELAEHIYETNFVK